MRGTEAGVLEQVLPGALLHGAPERIVYAICF